VVETPRETMDPIDRPLQTLNLGWYDPVARLEGLLHPLNRKP